MRINKTLFVSIVLLVSIAGFCPLPAQGVLTFEDVMKFEAIQLPVLSDDGNRIAFGLWPERGDGEVRIKHVSGNAVYTIERGERPQFSSNGTFVAAIVKPPFLELENSNNNNKPKDSLALLNTGTGETRMFENVRTYEFSNDGNWLLITHEHEEKPDSDNPFIGYPRKLVSLQGEQSHTFDFVNEASIDSTSQYLVFSRVDTIGANNALFAMDLTNAENEPVQLLGDHDAYYNNFSWDNKRSRLAFTATVIDTVNDYRLQDAAIHTWQAFDGEPEILLSPGDAEEGYRLRSRNSLTWTYDGTRLFYGVQDADMIPDDEKAANDSLTAENMFDTDLILQGVKGKVWHWDDPLIKTHERQTFNNRKNHLYTAVIHLDENRPVQLATKEMPYLTVSHHNGRLIASSDLPYQKLVTWDGRYRDFYLVDPASGDADRFLEMQRFGAVLSPNGKYAAWFDGTDWNTMNTETGSIRNLTSALDIPFADEDNDRPQPSSGYGIAGWTDGDSSVLIYDKYDLWQFEPESGEHRVITGDRGRAEQRIFRIRDLETDRHTFAPDERLLLTMYHDYEKSHGIYEARVGRSGVSLLKEDNMRFRILAKAENSDEILYTAERYDMYPNLRISDDRRFRNTRQLTHLYEDLKERWNWGYAELIEWKDLDGRPTQGIVVFPDDYDPEKTYPVFIYYYERFSQRLNDFNHPVTNHRPNIAQYVSDGYVFFMPDVWFTVPQPGYSATKSIVPGVHKLIEMGIADPDAIGLHGHSWSGYMTAHVVTQTDIFAAAVAGAPVGNMTSAYSGIRWGSGLARQFQYERTQSRLGVSMWENLNPYIENSPVFFADRINTPLMIQHGDADEAVPWYQSIELYLALRRNDKESVFLHYYNEPHHLGIYANKLDYAIKMKEYMDYYLRGIGEPEWIIEGVPFRD